jgi:hypothetical protein
MNLDVRENDFDALSPLTTQGDVLYHNGTDNVRLAKGTAGQVLEMNAGATAPSWGDRKGFVQFMSAGSTSLWAPADATTYYFSTAQHFNPDTTYDNIMPVRIPVACTLRAAYFEWIVIGTPSSGEDASVYIRLNNTTDVTVSTTAETNAKHNLFQATALSQAIAAGDQLAVKIVTPTWVTNPTSTAITGFLFFSIP